MTASCYDFEQWMLKAPKTEQEKKIVCLRLAESFAVTLPAFKDGLSQKQKRDLIRNHVGSISRFTGFSKYELNEYHIYSLTCQILASEYGLNSP